MSVSRETLEARKAELEKELETVDKALRIYDNPDMLSVLSYLAALERPEMPATPLLTIRKAHSGGRGKTRESGALNRVLANMEPGKIYGRYDFNIEGVTPAKVYGVLKSAVRRGRPELELVSPGKYRRVA